MKRASERSKKLLRSEPQACTRLHWPDAPHFNLHFNFAHGCVHGNTRTVTAYGLSRVRVRVVEGKVTQKLGFCMYVHMYLSVATRCQGLRNRCTDRLGAECGAGTVAHEESREGYKDAPLNLQRVLAARQWEKTIAYWRH